MEEEDTLCNILKDTNWPLTVYALICGLGFFGFVLFVHLLLDSFDLRGHFQLL